MISLVYVSAHDPNSDAAPSTFLSDRPADTYVEHRARRLGTKDSSQSITTLSPPQLAYTSPTISQARVKAPDSPIELSPCEGQDMINDQWSGTLTWSGSGEESDVCASVQATDGVRNPWVYFILGPLLVEDLSLCRQLSVWPSDLRLEIDGTRIHALDFQAWILRHRASVVRIQCAADMGEQDFGKLVKSLREDGRVSHYDSGQACLSQVVRSRLRGWRSKALGSADLFWRHIMMEAYSVPRSSLPTYLSSRSLHWSSRNRRKN